MRFSVYLVVCVDIITMMYHQALLLLLTRGLTHNMYYFNLLGKRARDGIERTQFACKE